MKDFIVIGAGQAGMAISYYLTQNKNNFIVVDASEEIGSQWLKRWDSLTLFTGAEYNNLPGLKFPHPKGYYANKYDIANYLKSYVEKFKIPIEFNQKIKKLKKVEDYFVLESDNQSYKTKNVIVATGPFHTPFTPKFHYKIADNIIQIHSEDYKSPNQLQEGETLVVGAGDSGVQILDEIADTNRKVYFSGNTNISSIPQEILGKTLWWWFSIIGFLSISKYTWLGKKNQCCRTANYRHEC